MCIYTCFHRLFLEGGRLNVCYRGRPEHSFLDAARIKISKYVREKHIDVTHLDHCLPLMSAPLKVEGIQK